jgi:hypothetical protein
VHDPTGTGRQGPVDPPFGLPVLDEVPDLAVALELARDLDALHRRLVAQLVELRRARVAERATGVALEQWLATLGRHTRTDRRMLLTCADLLGRLPLLAACYAGGDLSWSQLRTVVCKIRVLPREVDHQLDVKLADAIAGAADADPDALGRVVDWVVADLTPDPDEREPAGRPWLHLQPRLDGTGGTVAGDLDPVGFAALDAATAPTRDQLTGLGSRRELVGQDPTATGAVRTLGEARAVNLTDLCLTDAGDTGRVPRTAKLLVRAELDALLGGHLPAQLLTTLAGGRVQVDAATCRRLIDQLGADVRLVIVDRGAVVGVGRTTRKPPGWLTDAQLTLHDTCSEPGCHTAARVCDGDHAVPVGDGGTTDVANLAPECAATNRGPDRRRWQVTQTPDGVRVWRHRRTGLTTRTLPGTWRPPKRPPPDPDDGSDGDRPGSNHRDRAGRRQPAITSGDRPAYTTTGGTTGTRPEPRPAHDPTADPTPF